MTKKRKKRNYFLIFLIFLIFFLFGYFNHSVIVDNTKNIAKYNLIENLSSDINVVFCPSDACYNIFAKSFRATKNKISCAFYDFDIENLSKILLEKSREGVNVSLIVDDDYVDKRGLRLLKHTNVSVFSDMKRGTRYDNYMHDKFCVIDGKEIITGSANPTKNGFYKNNNNIVEFKSSYIAKNYENEFSQMSLGRFGYNKKPFLEYNNITLQFKNESYIISSFMCPQDDCGKEIIKILDSAKSKILFEAFAITNKDIGNELIKKSEQGVLVKGIVEKRNVNLRGSIVHSLNRFFEVVNDTNPHNMHNKFFIVDNKWVITGSMNPTLSGTKYNDENILIIRNSKFAGLYSDEFSKEFKAPIR